MSIEITLNKLSIKNLDEVSHLATQLNPNLEEYIIRQRIMEMFDIHNYLCFGCYKEGKLIGMSSGWLTVRIYSGKQLEIDNIIIDSAYQSQSFGEQFIQLIEVWAKDNNCETIELNAYVENKRAHKFYFKHEYSILGYHFQKKLR